jgi:hypothetical protein
MRRAARILGPITAYSCRAIRQRHRDRRLQTSHQFCYQPLALFQSIVNDDGTDRGSLGYILEHQVHCESVAIKTRPLSSTIIWRRWPLKRLSSLVTSFLDVVGPSIALKSAPYLRHFNREDWVDKHHIDASELASSRYCSFTQPPCGLF